MLGARPRPTQHPRRARRTRPPDSGLHSLENRLLAAVIVAVAVAVPLLLRARRRRAWREDLEAAEDEVGWLARVLVPELQQAESLDQAAGGWTVGSSQVSALEDAHAAPGGGGIPERYGTEPST